MQKGFTLLEIIVSVALFAMVATSATLSLLAINGAQKKAIFVQTNQDNIRFTLESMAREIRAGTEYSANCSATRDCFSFKNADRHLIFIRRSADPVLCGNILGSSGCIVRCDDTLVPCNALPPPNSYQPVTAPEVSISNLRFYVTGEDPSPSDSAQVRVTIIMEATTPGITGPLQSTLPVQTTISMLLQD